MDYKAASPELETKRLSMRWLTEEDAPLMLAIWNDPAFILHVGDREIRDIEQARQAMRDGILKVYRDQRMGPYGLFLHGSDEAMGICGLFKRENLEFPDIGYALLPAYGGKGYAFEAAQAVSEHARGHMALESLLAIVSPGHDRSINLLEKLGMTAGKQIRMPGDDDDVMLYSMALNVR